MPILKQIALTKDHSDKLNKSVQSLGEVVKGIPSRVAAHDKEEAADSKTYGDRAEIGGV